MLLVKSHRFPQRATPKANLSNQIAVPAKDHLRTHTAPLSSYSLPRSRWPGSSRQHTTSDNSPSRNPAKGGDDPEPSKNPSLLSISNTACTVMGHLNASDIMSSGEIIFRVAS